MSDEKIGVPASAAVPTNSLALNSLASGTTSGNVLTWNGSAWVSQTLPSNPVIVRGSFNPYATNTLTLNGLDGEITMLLQGGGVAAFNISMPYQIIMNNNQIAVGDMLFITVRFTPLSLKESYVWGMVESITNGQAIITLLCGTAHPFAGVNNVYVDFHITKG